MSSADAASRALQECFLANADRGDNAANDELVAELVRWIRAVRDCREGGCCRAVGWQDQPVLLRRELPVDQPAVRAVHNVAFGGGGDAAEALLVDDLRADGDVIAAPVECLGRFAARDFPLRPGVRPPDVIAS